MWVRIPAVARVSDRFEIVRQGEHAVQCVALFEAKGGFHCCFTRWQIFNLQHFALPFASEVEGQAGDGRIGVAPPSVTIPYQPLVTSMIKPDIIPMKTCKAFRSTSFSQPVVGFGSRDFDCSVRAHVSLLFMVVLNRRSGIREGLQFFDGVASLKPIRHIRVVRKPHADERNDADSFRNGQELGGDLVATRPSGSIGIGQDHDFATSEILIELRQPWIACSSGRSSCQPQSAHGLCILLSPSVT